MNAASLLSLADIKDAAQRLGDAIIHTPATLSRTLSDITGARVHLKFELLQFTASFKERGALNKLLLLSPDERRRGVVAMSAGNHAQAVAYHAARLKIPAIVVMPEPTPFTKVQNTQRFGAEVMLVGTTLSEAAEAAYRLATERQLSFVHPYDDLAVAAGQGTLALEYLNVFPNLDTLVVPIGGGGLISGVAVAAKSIKPDIKIIGVQTELYPSMKSALEGKPVIPGGDSVAEGIAVKDPGKLTREIVRQFVDDIYIVSERHIEDAIITLLEIENVLVEGAGAAGLAAIMEHEDAFAGQNVGLILTGGNIDLRLVASAIMRSLARDGRISRLRILIPDRPGQLAQISTIIAQLGGNVIEVEHQRHFGDVALKQAELNVIVETQDSQRSQEIIAELEKAGFNIERTGAEFRS